MTTGDAADPHHDAAVAEAGAPVRRAKAAIVMLHGRGANAGDMLSLAEILAQPDLAYLAPQAVGRSWYPYSFLAPIARNEPFLSSAMQMLDRVLGRLGTEGYKPERVVLLGFSQGACLALEYAARHALRYGGLIGLSGGLIGPEGTPRDYDGHFAGTPVFLGCSDVDPHIPVDRVHETARVLGASHASYDPDHVTRFWRILFQADRVFTQFRGPFLGKVSPVHFFWDSLDIAVTRFSGRGAPPWSGNSPNVGAWVMQEAYSHEISSCGFWPGNGGFGKPAFYSYAYPEPQGFASTPMSPRATYYDRGLGQHILLYDAVRQLTSPDDDLMRFLLNTYEAAADLGQWNRSALERAGDRT